jgi:cytosine/adenosine deaminase-related metal-dependent hydrolase
MYRKVSAHYIFPVDSKPLKQGIVVLDKNGTIVDLIDTRGELAEAEGIEFYDGILTPGFVDAHVHIELSHLLNKICKGTGITGFIEQLESLRTEGDAVKFTRLADEEMQVNGIIAAGDISNKTDSFEIKKNSRIRYFTFVEIFASNPDKADMIFNSGLSLFHKLREAGLPGSISPHAPYSMSDPLWENLNNFAKANPSCWSLHNQESEEENIMFLNKTGKLLELLQKFNPHFDTWNHPKTTSLQNSQKYFNAPENLLLVHNTFTSEEDLDSIKEYKHKTTLVLCPNSNLYIENRLPDVPLFMKSGFNIALGTDSLASNNRLSILEEMKTIQNNYKIDFNTLLEWATLGGARALRFEKDLGSLTKGKKPGINLIKNFNYHTMQLTNNSGVKVII